MTEKQQVRDDTRPFLPLGSVVILDGSVKKLLIVSRGTIVEGRFFDYGAFLYPEGMIDSKVAYFDHDNIFSVVQEGFADADDELAQAILNDAREQFLAGRADEPEVPATAIPVAPAASAAPVDDLFASVRDLGDDDE